MEKRRELRDETGGLGRGWKMGWNQGGRVVEKGVKDGWMEAERRRLEWKRTGVVELECLAGHLLGCYCFLAWL